MPTDTGALVTAALTALPSIIGAFRESHAAANPDAPPLTDAQALAALQAAVAQSLARDAELRTETALTGRADAAREGPTFGGSTGE